MISIKNLSQTGKKLEKYFVENVGGTKKIIKRRLGENKREDEKKKKKKYEGKRRKTLLLRTEWKKIMQ